MANGLCPRVGGIHGPRNGFGSTGGSKSCASRSRRAFFVVVTASFTIPPANGDELIRYRSKADGDQDPLDLFAESLAESFDVNKAPPSEEKAGNRRTNSNDLSFGDIVMPSSEEKSVQAGGLEQALQEKKSRRTIDPRTHG